MADVSAREALESLCSSIAQTSISSAAPIDPPNGDLKDPQPEVIKAEEDQSSTVFGNRCVLNDDQDEYTERILKTIFQSNCKRQAFEATEEDEQDPKDSDKKPCLIRMFKGDELDENFVYTDHDMASIISRIVNENMDCFEIEEVQTATYDRLKFFNEESHVDAHPGWEEIVHKTPVQELFSMIEFLREHARDSSESEAPPLESPFLDTTTLGPDPSRRVSESEKTCPEDAEKSAGPSVASATPARLPSDHSAQQSSAAQSAAILGENKHDGPGTEEKGPDTIVPMEGPAKKSVAEDGVHGSTGDASCAADPPKHAAGSRPKVAPLDLSMAGKTSAPALPLHAALAPALASPLTTAKLREALRPLEELFRRSAKDAAFLEPLAAAGADASSRCAGSIRACDSPLGPEPTGMGDGTPSTPVH